MSILTVGTGEDYSTIASAVAASSGGDTIDVNAGTYTNDFVTITHDLTLDAVGGTVSIVATEDPPDGKAIIDEGGSGVNVSITGFDLSGAVVADGNGAGIRYEGGTLTLNDDDIHDNQEGILAAGDPNGTITIENSTFADNGSGTGYTHNIYVGDIASLTVEDSTITGAVVGHDIKSRAENTTILDNTITDGASGTASYEIDLPNGGNAVIAGNIIEKGADAQNPIAISYGEEGNVYASSSLTVEGNTILNDDSSATTTAVANESSITASVTNNVLYGWTNVSSGAVSASGDVTLTTEPSLASLTTGDPTTATGTMADATTTASTTADATTSTDDATTDAGTTTSAAATTGTSGGDSPSSTATVTAASVGSAGTKPSFVSRSNYSDGKTISAWSSRDGTESDFGRTISATAKASHWSSSASPTDVSTNGATDVYSAAGSDAATAAAIALDWTARPTHHGFA